MLASYMNFVAPLTDYHIVAFFKSVFGHIPKFYSSIYYSIITYYS